MTATSDGDTRGLVRGLGVWSATAVVIGGVIGQAIFLVTSNIAREVGSASRVLAVWVIGGVIVLFGTVCYAELGTAMPKAGGDYLYLGRGLGSLFGFLFGWMTVLIQRPTSAAIMAAGCLRIAGFLLPSLTDPIFTLRISVPFHTELYPFSFTIAQTCAAVLIAAMTVINYFGIRTAGRVQVVLTALKVGATVAIIILGLTLGKVNAAYSASSAIPFDHQNIRKILTALVPVMLAYNGFAGLGAVGEEVVNPRRNIPRAVICGVLSVVGLYTLINFTYFRVLGLSQVVQSQHLASDAVVMVAGTQGAKWLTLAMMISVLGALHVNFLTTPRVSYAMARDGQFFGFAKRIQPAFHTPSGALLFHGVVAVLLVLTGTYEDLYSLMIFAVWMFFVLTGVALIRLRIREPALPRPYRAWGYPWTPVVFACAALAITINLWLTRPIRSSIGLAVILLGLPFYFRWRKKSEVAVSPQIGA